MPLSPATSSSPAPRSSVPPSHSPSSKTAEKVDKVSKASTDSLVFEVSPIFEGLFSGGVYSPPPTPPPTVSLVAQVEAFNEAQKLNQEALSRAPLSSMNGAQNTQPKLDNNQALAKACIGTAKTLIDGGGVDLFQIDKFGFTLLYKAIAQRYENVAKLLLETEPKLINISCTAERHMPLHIAARDGSIHIISLLLSLKPELDALNLYDDTALHMAAARGDITVYDMLVTAGAKTTIANSNGELAARPPASEPVPIAKKRHDCTEEEKEPELFNMTLTPR